MNIGEKFYCSKCMRELEDEGVCPYCQYDPMGERSSKALEEGTLLQDGRYQIGAVIGSGGFGITYAAWDYALSQPVAIKEYFPNALCSRDVSNDDTVAAEPEREGLYWSGLHRFSREARILGTLQNVGSVVTVFDWFEENNTAYIVMQYLRGIPLEQYVRENEVAPQRLIAMMRDIVDGLILVHAQGILHRDISPSNILVQDDGTLKLIDFGAAAVEERRLKGQDRTVIFNRQYAPVEQYDVDGMQGPWTDVYALSATLYALITGNPPMESAARKGNASLKSLSDQDIHLKRYQEKAIMDGLILQPEKRIQSMAIFRSILYNLPLPEEEKRRRKLIARSIVAIVAATIVSILVTLNFTIGFNLGDHIRYSLRQDGFHAVSYSGKEEELVVPENRFGIPVSAIETGAFQASEELEEVVLPGTVQSVGMLAFNECPNLKYVTLNEGIAELQPQSFASCPNLQAVYVPASLNQFSSETFSSSGNRFVLIGSEDGFAADLAKMYGLNYAEIEAIEEEEGIIVTKYKTDQVSASIPDEMFGKPVISIDSGIDEEPVFPIDVSNVVLPGHLQRIGSYALFNTMIEELDIPEGVQDIGEYAFAQTQLSSIRLPDTVETLGTGAFQDCIRLSEATLSEGMHEIPNGCFELATSLTDVTIPSGITEIGLLAFNHCDRLESLTVPEGVEVISKYAFQDCAALRTLYLPDSIQSMHPSALGGCSNSLVLAGYDYAENFANQQGYNYYDLRNPVPGVVISEKGNLIVEDDAEESEEKELPSYAWNTVARQVMEASQLKSRKVVLPERVESVGTIAFYGNRYLESLSAPETLKTIGAFGFLQCEELKEVDLKEGVEQIKGAAFLGCTSLEQIKLPDSIRNLNAMTFENCTSLKDANIPASLVILDSDVFANCGFESFTIPGNVTKCKTAFYGCKLLKKVTVEEGVRTLWGTFAQCEALEEVILPKSIDQISLSTFQGCANLRDAWIYSDDADLDSIYPGVSHFEFEGLLGEDPQGERLFPELNNNTDYLFSDSPKLTLHGYRGSSAQIYAQEHGIPYEEISLA